MKKALTNVSLSKLFWLAPVLFVMHVMEEAPGFVAWANSLVGEYVTDQQFLLANGTGLIITLLLAVAVSSSKEGAVVLLALAWLSFAMGANAIIHVTATLVHRDYAPGVITSVLLYIPYYVWFVAVVVKRSSFRTAALSVAIVVGALPMLLHGYLIVFEGTTLFQLP